MQRRVFRLWFYYLYRSALQLEGQACCATSTTVGCATAIPVEQQVLLLQLE